MGGMIASTFLSVIFIPVLYVLLRTWIPGRVRGAARDDRAKDEEGAHA
jgi:hypothetical protein